MQASDIFKELVQNKTVTISAIPIVERNKLLNALRNCKFRYVEQLDSLGLLADTNIHHKVITIKQLNQDELLEISLDFPAKTTSPTYNIVRIG